MKVATRGSETGGRRRERGEGTKVVQGDEPMKRKKGKGSWGLNLIEFLSERVSRRFAKEGLLGDEAIVRAVCCIAIR